LAAIQSLNVPETPLSEILEVNGIDEAVKLANLLKTSPLIDVAPSRSEISDSQLHNLFDSHRTNLSTAESDDLSIDNGNSVDISKHVNEINCHMEEVLTQSENQVLSTTVADFI